jgi:hypothetical protein
MKKNRSREMTALIVAVMLKNCGQPLAHVSKSRLKQWARRKRWERTFEDDVREELEALGIALIPVDNSNYAAFSFDAVDAAPSLRAAAHLPELRVVSAAKLRRRLKAKTRTK